MSDNPTTPVQEQLRYAQVLSDGSVLLIYKDGRETTMQALLHRENLRGRIDEHEQRLLNKGLSAYDRKLSHDRIAELEAELARLEGGE